MKNVYLIFLDIDGVLVFEKEMIENNNEGISPSAAKLLKDIVTDENREVDYKIIISSMWRLGSRLRDMKELFKPFGLDEYVVGMTPDIGFGYDRFYEIKKFLENTHIEYRDFVIIDDNKDMGDYLNRLIQTDSQTGFDEDSVEELLNKVSRIERMHNSRNFQGSYK